MIMLLGLFQGIIVLLLIGGTVEETENLTGIDIDNSNVIQTAYVKD